ncbi:hypothetical protein D3C75_1202680 [compost metagenome]
MKREYLTYKTIELRLREASALPPLPGVRILKQTDNGLKLNVDTSIIGIEEVLGQLVACCKIGDVTIEDPPMEEIIAKIYERTEKLAGRHAEPVPLLGGS